MKLKIRPEEAQQTVIVRIHELSYVAAWGDDFLGGELGGVLAQSGRGMV